MGNLGPKVPDWQTRPAPERVSFDGRYVGLKPTTLHHAPDLFAAFAAKAANWDYLTYGPFQRLADFEGWMAETTQGDDPLFYTFEVAGRAVGLAALMRITPAHGSIEVGHVHFSAALQGTPAATEGLYLLMCYAMDTLGYRRFEWKCNALNAPSRRAALRLGFTFEGIHRQSNVFKGHSRDTAWYSFLDHEWPTLRTAFEAWLAPANFDADGMQRRALSAYR